MFLPLCFLHLHLKKGLIIVMESLYGIHKYLVDNVQTPLRRTFMDKVNWHDRLIGIQGFRGSGKTNILVQYAKDNYSSSDRRCLYVNMNNFFFSIKPLIEFANEFQLRGGEVLLIDQTFKYSGWAQELSYCYNEFPKLKIVFTCPVAIQLDEEHELADKVVAYDLRGFSFREYIELQTGIQFQHYTLEEILNDHEKIARTISSQIRPLAFIDAYLREGFCPFHLEKNNFIENLLERLNMMLDVDLLSVNQIEHSYLPKLRKLIYILSLSSPCKPNVSQLSNDIEISRATVMNYIKFLEDSKIINLLYPEHEKYPKKPSLIYINNPNLLFATHYADVDMQSLRETFFYNQVKGDYSVNLGKKHCQFLVDEKYNFNIGYKVRGKFNPETYYAISGIECGEKNVIPLWLFGFLY